MDDQLLLVQLKDGQRSSLELLFRKYYEFLTNISFYITQDKNAAEDLTQELFITIWERREQLIHIRNLKGYLTIAIKNKSLDLIKSQQTQYSHMGQYLKLQETVLGEPEWDERRIKEEISKGLAQLPPKCRLIFSLNRFEGLTNEEIANYLQISKRTVETQISKALKILRLELKDVLGTFLSFIF